MLETTASMSGKALLSGNEAIARGALEAGVRVVAGYPGTPSTEIIENLAKEADTYDIHVEWSTNEKVAIEVAAGGSIAGLRSMVCMKHVGLNWASDPLMCINLSGVNGGLVIVSADDPGAQSSQNEQDSRFYGLFSEVLTLEPSTPSEAKDMVIEAFDISEKIKLPVIIRSVPRVSHSHQIIRLNPTPKSKIVPKFERDRRFVVTGASGWSVHLHKLLHDKKAEMQQIVNSSNFNVLYRNDNAKLGIITSGIAYTYVREAVKLLKTNEVSILKLGTVFPLPELLVKEITSLTPNILVVEEGEPFLEQQVRSISTQRLHEVKFMGKLTGHLPSVGELDASHVLNLIANLLGIKINHIHSKRQRGLNKLEAILPPRTLNMCAGCPHRATFYVLKQIVKRIGRDKAYLCGDIGCYSFGAQHPFNLVDIKYCMGASIGVACGLASAGVDGTVFALIGDGTFIHAGIPPLINAVYNSAKIVIIIFDNQTVAMTGFQPHPGVGRTATGKHTKRIVIEDLARACGADFVKVFDPYNLNEARKTMESAIEHEGVAVLISRGECATEFLRRARKEGIVMRKFSINNDLCKRCGLCVKEFGCPAFHVEKDEIRIIKDVCIGCGICAQLCPLGAIKELK